MAPAEEMGFRLALLVCRVMPGYSPELSMRADAVLLKRLRAGEEEGFVKIHVRKGSDEILGATIVAGHAGDLISEVTTAMVSRTGLGSLASVIHPYPTQADAIRKAGDLYNHTRLTKGRADILKRYFSWRR